MTAIITLLSIVVPTRNRAEYAIPAIRSLLSINDTTLEVVVEDNSDNTDIQKWAVQNVADSRLRLQYSAERVSMSENYERAIARARGKYVCCIGDDDGVNPEIVNLVRWADKQGYDAVIASLAATYGWPDYRMKYQGLDKAGKLVIKPFSGKLATVDVNEELYRCVKHAGQNMFKLPKVYYGIIRRSCMEQLKSDVGQYFPGVSPDLAGAIGVSKYTEKVCYVDYPIFLPGSSGKSNAGLSSMKRHVGYLHEQDHLSQYYIKKWSPIVPKFYSVETIWAEAAVEALRATDRYDHLRNFNVPLLHAMCFVFNPHYYRIILTSLFGALKYTGRGYLGGIVQFLFGICYTWLLRIRALLVRAKAARSESNVVTIEGIKDIDDAVIAFSKFLDSTEKPF